MDARKFSALKELNVWMYQHLESVLCVDLVLLVTLETPSSATVGIATEIYHHSRQFYES